jgi:hypothetical protein
MNPRKLTQLLKAMTTVHRLCREMDLPEILDMEAAMVVVRATIERGPQAVKEFIAASFPMESKRIN